MSSAPSPRRRPEPGLPVALPGRVDARSANRLVEVGVRSPGRDDSYALVRSSRNAPARGPRPIGPIALERVRRLMTERELAVLRSVDRFRYLTATQIEQLHFAGHASSATAARIRRRVLERLVATQILVRLERRIGGVRAGSAGHVYRIAPLGYRLVHDHATMSGRGKEPSATFLEHTLAVAQVAIDLVVAERQHKHPEQDGHDRRTLEIVSLQPEPECWRRFQIGLRGTEVLKPDLFVALATADYEDRWFVEVDRGTESTNAVVRKCMIDLDYLRSGIEQQKHDVFPKVLWIVPTAHRQRLIERAIDRTRGLRSVDLFVVVTAGDALATLTGSAS